MAAIQSCKRHLGDLKRAHRAPPGNVALPERSAVRLVVPILEQSYFTSPAAMCVEVAECQQRLEKEARAEPFALVEVEEFPEERAPAEPEEILEAIELTGEQE